MKRALSNIFFSKNIGYLLIFAYVYKLTKINFKLKTIKTTEKNSENNLICCNNWGAAVLRSAPVT